VVAFVAVGSNIDPERNVPAALGLLMSHETVTAVSTHYRTAPLDRPEQPPYVNGVWRVETQRDPRSLKHDILRAIETRLGRVRTGDAHASRSIDLDLIAYGDVVSNEPGLLLPDPDIERRPFLAVPLVELSPDFRLPGRSERLADHAVCRRAHELAPMPELTRQLKEMIGS